MQPDTDSTDMDSMDWEALELRWLLPSSLNTAIGTSVRLVLVPENVRVKLWERHASDVAMLPNLSEHMANWEYFGKSPKGIDRYEIYFQANAVWFCVVVVLDSLAGYWLLATMHRIYERKMRSRMSKNYLTLRENPE